MLNSRKNALRCGTANLGTLVLAGLVVGGLPQVGFAQVPTLATCTTSASATLAIHSNVTHEGVNVARNTRNNGRDNACAGGANSIALGASAKTTNTSGSLDGLGSIAIGGEVQ